MMFALKIGASFLEFHSRGEFLVLQVILDESVIDKRTSLLGAAMFYRLGPGIGCDQNPEPKLEPTNQQF
jgi:hypothetical protein